MSEKFDARQTETELEILSDQLICAQEGKELDSNGNEIKMSVEEIERAMQRLLNDFEDETYPVVKDEEHYG